MGELQGRIFGGYQLLDEIGSGGVAEVYRARHASGSGREVVVKVIYKEFARQPGFARNLAYVTEASARLASHPHILPLVAHGEESEYIYLVTPYVKEGTLADWINKGGRLGVADVGPFFQQICGALSYAHSLGVVHGNLKPSNIFLHEGRHILLGDFGLLWDVRALDPTWSGSGVEAFEYLAPEVFGGQITQASDMYSLGATLFHSLTGHTPFHMNKLADLIAAAQQQQPPRLAQQQPPLAPALASLDPVVAQAMAKRQEERFASAVQLAQAVEGALRQAVAHGMQVAPPTGQPQWQPLASTPVSAGVFNAPGPQIAPVFGAPPTAPGALSGAIGAAAAIGAAPLAQFESSFPPLPPSAEVDGAMEQGGAALSGGLAFGSSQIMDSPTMRVAAPPAGPTMHMPAPPAMSPGADYGFGGPSGALVDAAGQPITAPRQRAVRPANDATGSGPFPPQDFASSNLMPLEPPDALLDASIKRISQRLPAVHREGEADAAAQSGQFSPTELGLPRLTNPELANLPQDWQELLTDENAKRRHDPFAESSGHLPPIVSAEIPAASVPDLFGASISEPGSANRRATNWAAADPARPWDASARVAALTADADVERPSRKRSRKADYDIDDISERPPRRNTRKNADDDEFHDTMQEQKVWTNSRSIVRIGRHISAAPVVVFLLALVLLAELAGFAVARPDLCVTHACAVVAGEVEKYAPNLRVPGAPAPVTFAPKALTVSAITNGSGKTTVTLTNTGSGEITWTARTTLGWLSVSPAKGTLAKGAHTTLTLMAQPDSVTPGSYSAGLVVDAATGQSVTPVALTVTPGPVLAVTTSKLSFSACGVSQPLTISNTGGAKLSYTASPSQADALSVSPGNGSLDPGGKTTLTVTLSCAASVGQPYAVILVSDGGSAQTPVSYGS